MPVYSKNTLRASFAGTVLQALPELLTPLKGHHTLQALVYDILPLTTAVFSYAIGPRKLSANEQFFVAAQSDYIRRLFYN